MRSAKPPLLLALVLIAGMTARASGPIGIFAIVEKVILEPDDKKPQRIQIWGTFKVQQEPGSSTYSKAEKGYLYFRIPSSGRTPPSALEAMTLPLWGDLRKVAGTGEVVGFGGDVSGPPVGTVRKATEKPTSPEEFSLGNPVVKLGTSQLIIQAELKAAAALSH